MTDEVEDGLIDIASALQARESTARTRFDLDFLDPNIDQLKRSRLTWVGILPLLQRDLPSYSMSHETYERICDAVQDAPPHLKEPSKRLSKLGS